MLIGLETSSKDKSTCTNQLQVCLDVPMQTTKNLFGSLVIQLTELILMCSVNTKVNLVLMEAAHQVVCLCALMSPPLQLVTAMST